MAKKKELTYQAAYEELEQIVQQIDAEEPNVDELAALVKRAAELMKFCKQRLRQTEEEVQKSLEGLEEE